MTMLGTHPLGTFSLEYLLRDGRHGTLERGTIEGSDNGVNVYDENNRLKEELSGTKMRNWCVIGAAGQRVLGWYDVLKAGDSEYEFGPAYPHNGPTWDQRMGRHRA